MTARCVRLRFSCCIQAAADSSGDMARSAFGVEGIVSTSLAGICRNRCDDPAATWLGGDAHIATTDRITDQCGRVPPGFAHATPLLSTR